jgi:hypothetical protein
MTAGRPSGPARRLRVARLSGGAGEHHPHAFGSEGLDSICCQLTHFIEGVRRRNRENAGLTVLC